MKKILFLLFLPAVCLQSFSREGENPVRATLQSATVYRNSAELVHAVRTSLKQGNNELGDYVSVKDNTMDVSFDIDLPYDVPTNGKEQNVVLKEYKVPSGFKYYSVPCLDKDAFCWVKYRIGKNRICCREKLILSSKAPTSVNPLSTRLPPRTR